jgi:chromosome segregation ATPase
MADARHVQFARELEERDERVAAALETLQQLQADVAELRAHADAVESFRAAYPGERSRLEQSAATAREELAAREAERAEAESELERARSEEDAAAARRALTRAADAESSARRKLERTDEERASLEREAVRVEEELPRLESRASELGRRLDGQPRVTRVETEPRGLTALIEWTTRARAALFVAVGALEAERERIVREANELGAAALGDGSAATSVRLVRERIERS